MLTETGAKIFKTRTRNPPPVGAFLVVGVWLGGGLASSGGGGLASSGFDYLGTIHDDPPDRGGLAPGWGQTSPVKPPQTKVAPICPNNSPDSKGHRYKKNYFGDLFLQIFR